MAASFSTPVRSVQVFGRRIHRRHRVVGHEGVERRDVSPPPRFCAPRARALVDRNAPHGPRRIRKEVTAVGELQAGPGRHLQVASCSSVVGDICPAWPPLKSSRRAMRRSSA